MAVCNWKIGTFSFVSSTVLAVSMLAAPTVHADEYSEAANAACNHMRQCAKQNMGDIPPEYRAMVEQSLASMCQNLPSAENVPGFGPQHPMYAPAVACMRSITRLSCQQHEDGVSTPECDKLSNM